MTIFDMIFRCVDSMFFHFKSVIILLEQVLRLWYYTFRKYLLHKLIILIRFLLNIDLNWGGDVMFKDFSIFCISI